MKSTEPFNLPYVGHRVYCREPRASSSLRMARTRRVAPDDLESPRDRSLTTSPACGPSPDCHSREGGNPSSGNTSPPAVPGFLLGLEWPSSSCFTALHVVRNDRTRASTYRHRYRVARSWGRGYREDKRKRGLCLMTQAPLGCYAVLPIRRAIRLHARIRCRR